MNSLAQPLLFTGGVNLNRDARVIRRDQLAYSKNAFPVKPGILSKRGAISAYQIAINTLGTSHYLVQSFESLPNTFPYKYALLAHRAVEPCYSMLIASSLNQELQSLSQSVTLTLPIVQHDYLPVRFIVYRGSCIAIVPGIEGYYTLLQKPAGDWAWIKCTFNTAAVGILTQTQSIEVKPRNGAVYKQRMTWGNFGTGMGNWIAMADKATTNVMAPLLGAPLMSLVGSDILANNGRHIEVSALEGEDIVAMQEVTLGAVGSQIDSVLMLLTNRSCVFVSGEILQTNATDATDPNGYYGDYKETRINYECGCVGQRTLTKTPYGWIWASGDDVWLLRGNFPERIGTNIRPALLACPAVTKKHWAAAYADGVYVLQLITTSNATSGGISAEGEDINLETHKHEYWYLDLRDGPPISAEAAKWYGPMQITNEDASSFIYGPITSVLDDDGKQAVRGTVVRIDGRNLSLCDFLNNKSTDDFAQLGVMTGNEWQGGTQYGKGDIVRARRLSGTAGKTSRLHVCITQALNYDAESFNFVVGDTYRGAISRATGEVAGLIDNGATGTLLLKNVVGEFIDNEAIEDLSGPTTFAIANGELYNGSSGSGDPTWSNSDGGNTTDGTVVWQEIQGNDVAAMGIVLGQEEYGDYQADIRAVDSLLNDNTFEKLVRRVDANISANNLMNISATAIRDQGNAPKSLGTNTFGGESFKLGFDVLNGVIGGVKSIAKAFRPAETELVQCRSAQIKISDETSYVIDDTNNSLVIGFSTGGAIPGSYFQVTIANGSYALLDDVLTAIKNALNASSMTTALTTAGMTLGANPWSFSNVYSAAYPYFSNLILTTTSPGSFSFGVFWQATSDVAVSAGTILNDLTATNLYGARSKRLCTMLGFGMDLMANNRAYVSSNVFRFDGTQIVQRKNSKGFDISGLTVIVQPKGAIPFKGTRRS